MDIKDYIENDVGLEIPKNNGTSKMIYPIKARKCFSTAKGYNGMIIKNYCALYDEKTCKCDAGFKCENEIPKEKCYKAVPPVVGEFTVEIAEHWNYNLMYKILRLREREQKNI